MELAIIERRAFLFALKANYFDQGGILPSALDYYVAAGEALLSAAESGSKIPELKRKAALYCERAECIKRQLDDRAEVSEGRVLADDVGRDWDTLEDSAEACVDVVATENTVSDDPAAGSSDRELATDAALSLGDEFFHDYVVINNSAVDERRRSLDRRKFFRLFGCGCRCDEEPSRDGAFDVRRRKRGGRLIALHASRRGNNFRAKARRRNESRWIRKNAGGKRRRKKDEDFSFSCHRKNRGCQRGDCEKSDELIRKNVFF